MRNLNQAQTSLTDLIQQAGWNVTPDAMKPLRKIDFTKLVSIYDHEEHFLEQTFLQSLIGMRSARASTATDHGMITESDVETALRMLGVAAAGQSDATLSKQSRNAIVDSCGFCRTKKGNKP